MGSGGPGNIVHIDNLYVKTVDVRTNDSVLLGDFVIFDTTGFRTVVAGDFALDDRFFDLQTEPVFQALEDANNLTTTPIEDRKDEVAVAILGTDWVAKMAAGVLPGQRVGIHRLDARTPIIAISQTANAAFPTLDQSLGHYQHKEFARKALVSVLNDDGVIHTV